MKINRRSFVGLGLAAGGAVAVAFLTAADGCVGCHKNQGTNRDDRLNVSLALRPAARPA